MTTATATARVSVLIATYNRGQMLEQSLQSVLDQTLAPHQVFVIDDGSTDDTAARVARFGEGVSYLRLSNGGKARALNTAMPLVTGDFVWIFDDDDVALPTSIADRVAAFTPDTGVVFSKHYWGTSGPDGHIERGELLEWPDVDPSSIALTLMRGCFTTLQGALVRTECYRRVGPFREELLRSQDYDMLIRLARCFTAALLPQPTFVFRRHDGQRGAPGSRHAAADREKIWARFDAIVGRRLRAESVLGEYLVPPVRGALTPQQERTATLNRLAVMAGKGLADAMVDDAIQFAACMQRDGTRKLSTRERTLLIGATQELYFLLNALEDPADFVERASLLNRSGSGRAVLRLFARGLLGVAWWGLRDSPSRVRAVGLAARLLGWSLAPWASRAGAGASV
jgi:hypothetical protein